MIFAYYLHDLSPFFIKFTDGIKIHWYGLAYVLGFYLTYRVMYFLAKRGLSEIKPDAVADFITMVALFGLVLGGRLGYMLLYNFDEFIHAPWTLFLINQGGMASHGGIAGVTLFCGWYAWKHKISWAGIGDSIVCGAPLGVFLGRIANFINGELFGHVTTVSWAVKFPTEILHEDFVKQGGDPALRDEVWQRGLQHSPDIIAYFEKFRGGRAELEQILHPRHPSQLYEALGEGLLLSAILIFLRLRFPRLRQGIIAGLFFILYAIARIALEYVRQPDSGSEMIMGLTKGQFFSTFMFIVGGLFIGYGLIWGKSPPGPAAAKA
ncbi:MAG: prolipoprotein diacylglyceryl transferase [Prosthecobacter sp.]|uniref:prolipoprotein diacylglyceryl transferase n=1 Tax=Prosthecobacter sp. TaxID=1965333 RepID=UPI0025D3568A|nr:prolipoprotein diacylglyceryl transferase [Prosthecobacter sp.]MCF7788089.1 prolipoprotein diacylglyceryl transferase [Prosthecobacter sp.]